MALKIRLRQQGRTNKMSYRLVVTDSRAMRDGKYLESIGWYDPLIPADKENVNLKPDRLQHWLAAGAQLTDKAESLVARAQPEVLRQYKEKVQAHRKKVCEKRKARRRAVRTSEKIN